MLARSEHELDVVALARVRELFRDFYVAIEIKARRTGQRVELACRWCGRRGYHLKSCPRAKHLRGRTEIEVRIMYWLELASRELAHAGGPRMT